MRTNSWGSNGEDSGNGDPDWGNYLKNKKTHENQNRKNNFIKAIKNNVVGKEKVKRRKAEKQILSKKMESKLTQMGDNGACSAGIVSFNNAFRLPNNQIPRNEDVLSAKKFAQSKYRTYYKDSDGNNITDGYELINYLRPGDVVTVYIPGYEPWHTFMVLENNKKEGYFLILEYHMKNPVMPDKPYVEVWKVNHMRGTVHYSGWNIYGGGALK